LASENGSVRKSVYDRALALCPTDAARVELSRLGAELNLGASSSEWIMVVLYAESRGLFGKDPEKTLGLLCERLERVEQGVDNLQKQQTPATARSPVMLDNAQLDRIKATIADDLAKPTADMVTQLGRIETRLQGLQTKTDTFTLARDLGSFIAGMVLVLLLAHFQFGARVPVQWQILSAGAFGAAAVVLALVIVVRVHAIFEKKRWR
jgi:hypothetical protein